MNIVLCLANILFMTLIFFIKRTENFRTSTGKNILLGFGIFFTIGSLFTLFVPDKEPTIIYSILAIIVYIVYFQKTKILTNFKINNIKEVFSKIKNKACEKKIEKEVKKIDESKKETKSDEDIQINLKASNKKTREKQGTKPSTIIGALIIVGVICVFANIISSTPTTVQSQTRDLLLNEYNLSEQETDIIINIINECGFSNYSLEDCGEENEIYYFIIKQNNSNISGGLDIKDGKVLSIDYAGNILYENGTVQHTLSEYIITSNEKVDLVYNTQEVIKAILKSPSTAKFPWVDEWKVAKKDGSTIVQGYVDSQNSFGAMIRSTFQVTYTNSIVTSLIFDGQEYIK